MSRSHHGEPSDLGGWARTWRGTGRLWRGLALAATLSLVWTAAAVAHPEQGRDADLSGDVAPFSDKAQHGGESGHLASINENVALIGKSEVSQQGGSSPRGRVADVAAFGDHAYLTAFRTDDCLGGGAWVMDISDPTNPVEVGFLPTTDGNYAGEGADVIDVEHGALAGHQLFIHQNEILTECVPVAEATGKTPNRGGINIWDVTDPTNPVLLAEHVGDMTPNRENPPTVHSAFAWNSHIDEKVYVVLVDNAEFTDVDILDITDPGNPILVNDTLDLWELFGVQQSSPAGLTQVFNHDMMVYRKADRYVMNVNYWDGGYVLLDVTDPTPGNVSLIAETDFAELDEERLARGHEVAPEGNAHQSELSPNFKYMIGTDEDFAPYGTGDFRVTTGDNAGTYPSSTVGGAQAPAALDDLRLNGPTVYVGYACPDSADLPQRADYDLGLAEGEEAIAVIQRGPVNDPSAPEGACFPGQKADRAMAAGWDAVLFVNHHNGDLASPDSPFCGSGAFTQPVVAVCTTHAVYHHLFDSEPAFDLPYVAANEPEIGDVGQRVDVAAEFNGWGYVRLFRTQIPGGVDEPGSITQLDTYAVPESQDESFAQDFGDLSVHEVAMDPRQGTGLAYLSYYAAGFRVLQYGPQGLQEVGAFIDEGGNNFWGVEVHRHSDGEYYVLASDRDHGLYIFQYTGKIVGAQRASGR